MKDYLIKLGKQAKTASVKAVTSRKKNKVLKDYCILIFNNQLNIIRENEKDFLDSDFNKESSKIYTH